MGDIFFEKCFFRSFHVKIPQFVWFGREKYLLLQRFSELKLAERHTWWL